MLNLPLNFPHHLTVSCSTLVRFLLGQNPIDQTIAKEDLGGIHRRVLGDGTERHVVSQHSVKIQVDDMPKTGRHGWEGKQQGEIVPAVVYGQQHGR